MNILMIGVDKTSVGGMLTVVDNYLNDDEFCQKTNLKYVATVIRSNKIVKILAFIKALPRIITTIKRNKIDILHVHMAERGSIFREGFVIWLAHKLKIKSIIHMHGATIEEWYHNQNRLVQEITTKVFRTADRIIVLGYNWVPFMNEVVGQDYEKRIFVLHNAVNVERTNQYNPNAKSILFYGVIIQRKGIDVLLEAFGKLLPCISSDICLRIYGDDIENSIMNKIRQYGLTERVVYCGWLIPEKQRECFSDTMLNILPSYNEGLPMTILETMGYGIPNISTKIAAIPEVIEDGTNGILIEPGDVDALAEAMKRLVLDINLRLVYSQEAFNRVQREFSMEYHKDKLLGLYDQLL